MSARLHVLFSGTVQGVGFRYTTHRIAANFAVVGFVRNLPNGTVELLVEGKQAELEAFVAAISSELGDLILDSDVSTGDATGEFTAFDIRR